MFKFYECISHITTLSNINDKAIARELFMMIAKSISVAYYE